MYFILIIIKTIKYMNKNNLSKYSISVFLGVIIIDKYYKYSKKLLEKLHIFDTDLLNIQ